MRLAYALLCITAVVSPSIWGQEEVHQQLYGAIRLERQGRYDAAIQNLQSITSSSGLTRVDQGRALTLLGFAYKESGQFQQAQAAFEKALNILERDPEHRADLGNALDLSAGLYQTIGKPQAAEKLWLEALGIFQQLEDHRSMAKIYADLAATELEQKHIRAAKSFFSKATAEMTSDLTDDDHAFICDIHGWIDEKTRHAADAASDYEQALAYWKKTHGEEHPFTGWRYLLLGSAYAAEGKLSEAEAMMRDGLTILDRTVGRQNPRYLAGEMMYARVLDRCGKREEAAQLKTEATQRMSEIYHSQCVDCTTSVWSLR